MFDKILYINLKHRTDRNENVIEELNKLNLQEKAVRIDAVNGRELNINKLPDNLITKKGKEDALNENQKVYTYLTPGAIGCAISHKKTYEYIVNNRLKSALILEDDITIDEDFNNKLNGLLRNIPKDFDILFLGYHSTSDKYLKRVNTFYSKPTKLYGLFGYIVTFEGAKKLLEIFPITQQIDSEIPLHFDKIKAYAVNPNKKIILSDQSSIFTKFGTDIQIRDENKDKENYEKLLYYTKRILFLVFLIFMIFNLYILYDLYKNHK